MKYNDQDIQFLRQMMFSSKGFLNENLVYEQCSEANVLLKMLARIDVGAEVKEDKRYVHAYNLMAYLNDTFGDRPGARPAMGEPVPSMLDTCENDEQIEQTSRYIWTSKHGYAKDEGERNVRDQASLLRLVTNALEMGAPMHRAQRFIHSDEGRDFGLRGWSSVPIDPETGEESDVIVLRLYQED